MPAQLGVPRRSWAAPGTKFPFCITNKGALILSPLLFFLQPGFLVKIFILWCIKVCFMTTFSVKRSAP